MNAFFSALYNFFTGTLNEIAWVYILMPCVFIGGLYFTVRSRGTQFTKFGYTMKHTLGSVFRKTSNEKGAVTPFQAVTTALAATVGTGNIIGTCQAIALGGYGAVFWLWIAALLGMIIKYAEVTLSVRYRERNADGDWVGGPMYYIKNGLGNKWKWLAAVFAVFAALASFGIGNLSQANSISGSINNAINAFVSRSEGANQITSLLIGIVIAVLVAFTLFGGIKRIGKFAELLIPFMSIFYILFSLIVIGANIGNIGGAFAKILTAAFTPEAVLGAGAGIALKEAAVWGLRRSAFSNEAGLGSAAIAHAAADTNEPVEQGLFGIFEVFMDTLVVCTMTALTVIVSGVDINFGVKPGAELITAAFSTAFGNQFASLFVAVALALFAFSTILGWALYGTRCVEYLFGIKASKVYQILFVLVAILGATTSLDMAWNVADTFNGLMAIPNFIALFALSGTVCKLTRDYFKSKNDPLK